MPGGIELEGEVILVFVAYRVKVRARAVGNSGPVKASKLSRHRIDLKVKNLEEAAIIAELESVSINCSKQNGHKAPCRVGDSSRIRIGDCAVKMPGWNIGPLGGEEKTITLDGDYDLTSGRSHAEERTRPERKRGEVSKRN